MSEFLTVLALSALPALGNLAGGILAEIISISRRTLSLALHGAAGIVFAVVGVELMPHALQAQPSWIIVLAFILGGGAFIIMDRAADLVRSLFAGFGVSDPWVLFFGVAVDLLSDGIMIGTSATFSLNLGFLLALGQVTADVPEGLATIATFKRAGIPRKQRILFTFSLALPVFAGATLGYWLMRGQPLLIQASVLSLTAGILTALVTEGIMPEAHVDGEARLAALVVVSGFGLFTLLSRYLQ